MEGSLAFKKQIADATAEYQSQLKDLLKQQNKKTFSNSLNHCLSQQIVIITVKQ